MGIYELDIKLKDLRVDHLNSLYTELLKTPLKRPSKTTAKIDLAAVCKEKKISRASIARKADIAESTVSAAVRGKPVNMIAAQAVAKGLGLKFEKAFTIGTGAGHCPQRPFWSITA